jgi:hypothetical protein
LAASAFGAKKSRVTIFIGSASITQLPLGAFSVHAKAGFTISFSAAIVSNFAFGTFAIYTKTSLAIGFLAANRANFAAGADFVNTFQTSLTFGINGASSAFRAFL